MPVDTSTRKPPDDKLLARVIAAIGKTDAPAAERTWFENWLRMHERNYWGRLPAYQFDTKKIRIAARKLKAITARRREVRAQMAALDYELGFIQRIKLSGVPLTEENWVALKALTSPEFMARVEAAELSNVETFLTHSDNYRKDPVRRLAVEPYLMMLWAENVLSDDVQAPPELPLKRMVEEMLTYLGIDPRRWPTNLGNIVGDIRSHERQPSQRPKH